MKKKYKQEVKEYQILISEHMFIDFWRRITENVPPDSSSFGYLIGLAKPIFKETLCRYCKKPIEVGKSGQGFYDNVHKRGCVKKLRKTGS